MKLFCLIIFILVFSSASFSQNEKTEINKRTHDFAVSISAYPFYKFYGHDGFSMYTISGEYITGKHKIHKTTYSFIYGFEMSGDNFENNIWGAEITKIFGKRTFFLEIGGGISYNFYLVYYPRIGGRVHIGEHMLAKVAYIPYLRSSSDKIYYYTDHFATISIGYRFRVKKIN